MLETTSRMRKNEIWTTLIKYLINEEIISGGKNVVAEMSPVELKKLELQEREKEWESQLYLKELEFKEFEWVMQLKIRKLQLASATPIPTTICTEFDVSKQIRFVTSFQMAGVDKDFLHFKKSLLA